MGQEKSCGAVVFRRSKEGIKYLILHYEAKHWDFPKGKLELNETEEEAAKREIKEETRIDDAQFAEGFRQTISYFYRKNDEVIHKEVVVFLAETKIENVKLSFEHVGYVWMGYENAEKKLTFNNSKEVLKKADEFLGKS